MVHNTNCDTHKDNDFDLFLEKFGFAITEMAHIYSTHRDKKGDSWEEMTQDQLRRLFDHELEEYFTAVKGSPAECHELLDVMNVGFMLLTKLSDSHNRR